MYKVNYGDGVSFWHFFVFFLVAENSSFKTGSEVAAHEGWETPRVWCKNEMNEASYTEFSCLFPKELEGPLPTNVTFVFY